MIRPTLHEAHAARFRRLSRARAAAIAIGLVLVGCGWREPKVAPLRLPVPARPPTGEVWWLTSAEPVSIEPGARRRIAEMNGGGVIRRIWLRAVSIDRRYLRNLVLEVTWDGAETPCVAAPVGDLFAVGPEPTPPFHTMFTSWNRGGMEIALPMPFEESARLDLVNGGKAPLEDVEWRIEVMTGAVVSGDWGRFHARFGRSVGVPLRLVDVEGSGWFVGQCVTVESPSRAPELTTRWGPTIVADGNGARPYRSPSLLAYWGGGGDGWDGVVWQAPGTGISHRSPTRVTGYRWHGEAPIPFRNRLEVTVAPRGRPRAGEKVVLSGVGIWYQKEAHHLPPVSYLAESVPPDTIGGGFEGEHLLPPLYSSGDLCSTQITTLLGVGWSGNGQLLFQADATGDFVVLEIPGLDPGVYDLTLRYAVGSGFGTYEVRQEGARDGIRLPGANQSEIRLVEKTLRGVRVAAGRPARLRFTAIDGPGSGRRLGLDHLAVTPVRSESDGFPSAPSEAGRRPTQ